MKFQYKVTLRECVWNIKCGFHSGFSPCCVLFFISIWKPLGYFDKNYRKSYFKWMDKHFPKDPGYIICPLCVSRHVSNTVQRCGCSSLLRNKHPELKNNWNFWEKVPWTTILFYGWKK